MILTLLYLKPPMTFHYPFNLCKWSFEAVRALLSVAYWSTLGLWYFRSSCLNMTLAQVFDLGPYLNYLSLCFLIGKMEIMLFALWVDIRLRDDGSTVVGSKTTAVILLKCFSSSLFFLTPGSFLKSTAQIIPLCLNSLSLPPLPTPCLLNIPYFKNWTWSYFIDFYPDCYKM